MTRNSKEKQLTLCRCSGYHRTHVYSPGLCSPDPAKDKHLEKNR